MHRAGQYGDGLVTDPKTGKRIVKNPITLRNISDVRRVEEPTISGFAMKGPTPDSWVRGCLWLRRVIRFHLPQERASRADFVVYLRVDRMASEFGRLGVSSLRSYSEAADRFGFGSVDAKSRQQSR
jgi:hypothetical protein